jgi:hypothetical protein
MLGLLQRILPDFASYGDVELLQRFLFLGVREIKVVDVRKLDCRLAKEGKVWRLSFVFVRREMSRTSATLAGVCSPGPDLSKSARSLTDPVNGMRMMLPSIVSAISRRGRTTYS